MPPNRGCILTEAACLLAHADFTRAASAADLVRHADAAVLGSAAAGTSASVGRSAAFEAAMFAGGCMRAAASSPCPAAAEAEHYYAATAVGLYDLLRWHAAQARMLTAGPAAQLTSSSPRFRFLWRSSTNDLDDGLTHVDDLILGDTESMPMVVQSLQIATLVRAPLLPHRGSPHPSRVCAWRRRRQPAARRGAAEGAAAALLRWHCR